MTCKILLLEKNAEYAKKLIPPLKDKHGYEVVHVNTELAVVRELTSSFFDLVIVGIHHEGEKEGFRFIEVLFVEKRGITVTPIMVISDVQDPDFIRWCIEVGVDDYLLYPEDPAEILPRLEKILGKSGGIGEMLVRISTIFLGPAARIFLEQQAKEKLNLPALKDLRRDHLPELLRHIAVIIKPILKEKMVQFFRRIEQVFSIQRET